jgi:hypothetical protein
MNEFCFLCSLLINAKAARGVNEPAAMEGVLLLINNNNNNN